MRLIAVNERAALYLQDHKQPKRDEAGFIASLLEIRTARDLISFLIDHADVITDFKPFRSIDVPTDDETWFSQGAVMNAADTMRISYRADLSKAQERFDSQSLVELVGKIDTATSDTDMTFDELMNTIRSVKRHEVVEVVISKIRELQERWESLLTFAAIGNGSTPPDGFITSQDDKANVFAIHHEAIEKAMPDGHFPLWDYFKSHRDKITKEVGHEFGNGLHMSVTRQMCVFNLVNVPNDPQTLLRLTCGRIAADGINEWTTYGGAYNQSTIWQRVEFDIEGGYRITDKTDLVIDALRNLIASNRIRLCAVCGRPFVIKRKGRQYCGDVCKQKAFTARKEGR